jgi:tRNA pseudouridine55 synthase
MDGILCIDKPVGPTSFDVVREVRKKLKVKKVGHAGTLDPLASGLLVVCVGQGTKLVPYLMAGEKRYEVTVALGRETDTLDADGAVTREAPVPTLDVAWARVVLEGFVGEIHQLPPVYSALKRGGEPLYRKARRGEAVDLEKRPVQIHAIELVRLGEKAMWLDVSCGQGTYIRSLARDIALAIGTVGHVERLRRTSASGRSVQDAIPFDVLKSDQCRCEEALISLADAVSFLPKLVLSDAERTAVQHGQAIDASSPPKPDASSAPTPIRLLSEKGNLVAIAERAGDRLKTIRVFTSD